MLLLAPAERADLIVDFRDVPAGSTLILYNDAPAPFPMGDRGNDYYPGNPEIPGRSIPGFGPNTRTLLQIRVKARVGPADPPITLPGTLHAHRSVPGDADPGRAHRQSRQGCRSGDLTLNEDFDEHGRLIQFLGTDQLATGAGPDFGRAYMDDADRGDPSTGATEVWEIVNLTGDTHPIHFHLVNVQVLSRQAFRRRASIPAACQPTRGRRSPRIPTSWAGRRRCA